MADNFGIKIGLEGEKEFKKAIADINQSFKVLGSEMKLVSSEFGKNDTSMQAVAARSEVLNKQIDAQKQKIEVLRQALRRFSAEFIDRRLRLDYTPTGLTVLTDEKWLCFVLEQLLSNALKYTREGSITVELAGERVLAIRDTGIGIAPEDLPRIFEKGYTGQNGRADKRASGLGLYLCSRICRNLGVGLTVKSTSGVGTTLLLDFTQYPLRVE